MIYTPFTPRSPELLSSHEVAGRLHVLRNAVEATIRAIDAPDANIPEDTPQQIAHVPLANEVRLVPETIAPFVPEAGAPSNVTDLDAARKAVGAIDQQPQGREFYEAA